jgi:hypothetical protein
MPHHSVPGHAACESILTLSHLVIYMKLEHMVGREGLSGTFGLFMGLFVFFGVYPGWTKHTKLPHNHKGEARSLLVWFQVPFVPKLHTAITFRPMSVTSARHTISWRQNPDPHQRSPPQKGNEPRHQQPLILYHMTFQRCTDYPD